MQDRINYADESESDESVKARPTRGQRKRLESQDAEMSELNSPGDQIKLKGFYLSDFEGADSGEEQIQMTVNRKKEID